MQPTTSYHAQTHATIIWDQDGTLAGTGVANTTVARKHPFNQRPGDITLAGGEFVAGNASFSRFSIESSNRTIAQPVFRLTRPDGLAQTIFGDANPDWNQQCAIMIDWAVNDEYTLTWIGVTPPNMKSIVTIGSSMQGSIILKVPNLSTGFTVHFGPTSVSSLTALRSSTSNKYYYDSVAKIAYFKITNYTSDRMIEVTW